MDEGEVKIPSGQKKKDAWDRLFSETNIVYKHAVKNLIFRNLNPICKK